MTKSGSREYQIFPHLTAAQVETARRFVSGPLRTFAAHETVYAIGEQNTPSWLVMDGTIDIVRRDGLDREVAIITLQAGQFTGEVNQLAGRTVTRGGSRRPRRMQLASVRRSPSARPDDRIGRGR